jgi:hypothetical protein
MDAERRDIGQLTDLLCGDWPRLAIVASGPVRPDLPLTYDAVREQIFTFIDFANLEMYFAWIAHWLGELPAADRDRILRELDDIAAGSDPGRQDEASFLLNDLGLRHVRWTDDP